MYDVTRKILYACQKMLVCFSEFNPASINVSMFCQSLTLHPLLAESLIFLYQDTQTNEIFRWLTFGNISFLTCLNFELSSLISNKDHTGPALVGEAATHARTIF